MESRLELQELQRKWSPPAELDTARPRPVGFTVAGRIVLVIACALLLGGPLAGVSLERIALRQAAEWRLLQQEGLVTEGQVTRISRAGEDSNQRSISYRFVAEGRTYGASATAAQPIWRNLKVGSPIAIRYLLSRPELNCPSYVTRRGMPVWLALVIAAIMGAGGAAVALVIRRQWRLLTEGRPAVARVTRLGREMHSSHSGNQGRKYYYEFVVLSGAIAKGQAGPTKRFPAVGNTLCVLYDPDSPARNAPYPFSLVRVSR